jgi:hypothetical protein
METQTLEQAWQQVFTPRDRRPIPEWAKDCIWLVPPITKTGFFDVSGSRHFIDIFGSLQNDHKRETNVLKPVRGGGSLIGDVFCPWTFANDPGPYMDVFQTDKVADDHAEARIIPTFNNCLPVKRLLPMNRHKQRDNEIVFLNGYTWYVRGPSLGNLQAKGIRYLRLEEVWMWAQGLMGEAEGRVGDYLKMQTSKILRISQAGPMDGIPMEESDWHRAYHKGQIHEWEVRCLNPDCGKFFDPIFSGQRADGSFWGIQWNHYKLSNGDWDLNKCIATVRFECPHCSHPHLDNARTKSEWNRTGQYRRIATISPAPATLAKPEESTPPAAQEADRKKDSFHWEAVIDFPWDELASLWLDACNAERRGDLKPKVQFYQKRRAMFKDEETLLKGGLHFRRSTYEINSEWPDERGRFLTVDRQEEDLFWWTVRAWSHEKTRKLGFGKCYGFAAVEKLRIDYKVEPRKTFVDSAFQPKGDNGVYAACAKYGWIAIRGAAADFFPHRLKNKRTVHRSYSQAVKGDPGAGTSAQGRQYAWVIFFSKPAMNAKVQELIDNGRWEEPLNTTDPEMEKEYSVQMAARVKKSEFNPKTGITKVFWKESKNDHARDLANGQCLGAMLCDLLPDPMAERLSTGEQNRMAAADAAQ